MWCRMGTVTKSAPESRVRCCCWGAVVADVLLFLLLCCAANAFAKDVSLIKNEG